MRQSRGGGMWASRPMGLAASCGCEAKPGRKVKKCEKCLTAANEMVIMKWVYMYQFLYDLRSVDGRLLGVPV